MNMISAKRGVLLAFGIFAWAVQAEHSRIVNGTVVPAGQNKEIVSLVTDGPPCTATVVGPRVVLTAAHCANKNGNSTFIANGVTYTAKMTRSPDFLTKEHYIALGVTDKDIQGVDPATIGGSVKASDGVLLYGFGCTDKDGTGADGKLRTGATTIIGFSKLYMVSKLAGGAAICFGDSGGPTYMNVQNKNLLVGVSVRGNVIDTNSSIRTDVPESKQFFQAFANDNGVQICGVNKDCGGTPPPPPPAKPTCTLTADPVSIKIGNSLKLSLLTQGEVTSATLDGASVTFPTFQKTITPAATGSFISRATVVGDGGSNTCEANYVVTPDEPPPPPKPTCSLAAIPDEIKLGESLTLEMMTTGTVTSAKIDGTVVSVTGAILKKMIQPIAKGGFTASGEVTGPGGTNVCSTSYQVKDDAPNPNVPNFAVVKAYCGDNTIVETQISRVCLAVIKKDSDLSALRITQALLITYSDTSREVLPIIHRKVFEKDPSEVLTKEEIISYANGSIPASNYLVLDIRKATLTSNNGVPVGITGSTVKGDFYKVDKLTTVP